MTQIVQFANYPTAESKKPRLGQITPFGFVWQKEVCSAQTVGSAGNEVWAYAVLRVPFWSFFQMDTPKPIFSDVA